eukprot:gene24693-biopygen20911
MPRHPKPKVAYSPPRPRQSWCPYYCNLNLELLKWHRMDAVYPLSVATSVSKDRADLSWHPVGWNELGGLRKEQSMGTRAVGASVAGRLSMFTKKNNSWHGSQVTKPPHQSKDPPFFYPDTDHVRLQRRIDGYKEKCSATGERNIEIEILQRGRRFQEQKQAPRASHFLLFMYVLHLTGREVGGEMSVERMRRHVDDSLAGVNPLHHHEPRCGGAASVPAGASVDLMGRNGRARAWSAPVSLNSIARPAPGPRPSFLPLDAARSETSQGGWGGKPGTLTPRGSNGCGRAPDASHAIELEGTGAPQTRPELLLPVRAGGGPSRKGSPSALHSTH